MQKIKQDNLIENDLRLDNQYKWGSKESVLSERQTIYEEKKILGK